MTNVFSTARSIDVRFDLKGSKIGRKVLQGNEADEEILKNHDLALKDLDFEASGLHINFGPKSPIIKSQLVKDAEFLCSIGSIDYSLLLGVHFITNAEGQDKNIGGQKQLSPQSSLKLSKTSLNSSQTSTKNSRHHFFDFEDGGVLSEDKQSIYFLGVIDILTEFNCF